MARISTYAVDSTIAPNDKLIGTDAEDSDLTKNYRISDLSAYIGTQLKLETLALTNKSIADQEPSGLDIKSLRGWILYYRWSLVEQ